MRVEDQKRQLEALTILDACMSTLEPQQLLAYEGLCVHVYHPEVSPIGSQAFVEDDGMYTYRTSRINSFVGEDGVLHLVSHRASLSRALLELDTEKARLLSQVGAQARCCKCVGWGRPKRLPPASWCVMTSRIGSAWWPTSAAPAGPACCHS